MTTPSTSRKAPDGAGSGSRRGRRSGVAADLARAIRTAPEAGPLVVARRRVAQHLADALERAMRDGADLLVVKLNAQLELAIARAELEAPRGKRPAGGGDPDDDDGDGSLDAELAALAASAPTVGD